MNPKPIAMVMCAGEGTRLRPLTYTLSKPTVPIANRPVLEYTLLNLKKHGVQEVIINLSYKPKLIQNYFQDGARLGLKINYTHEKKLLGTAGGVKNAEKYFKNSENTELLIASGDSLTDINLTSFLDFHKKKKAFCTIATKKVDTRFEYGVVITDRQNRVERFVEKPAWSSVFSNQVNSGIYIFNNKVLDLIPKNRFFDFGNDLFPRLLKNKMKVFGFNVKEFWTDIGNLQEYRRAQKVVLDRGISFGPRESERKTHVWIGGRTKIESSARIERPCLIGNDCVIGKNAIIGAYSVIGNGSKISSNARIYDSVLWENVMVSENCSLKNCVVLSGARVSQNTNFVEGIIFNN